MVIEGAYRTIFRRIVWYLLVLYIFAYLDRINIGFAAVKLAMLVYVIRLAGAAFSAEALGVFLLARRLASTVANLLQLFALAAARAVECPYQQHAKRLIRGEGLGGRTARARKRRQETHDVVRRERLRMK